MTKKNGQHFLLLVTALILFFQNCSKDSGSISEIDDEPTSFASSSLGPGYERGVDIIALSPKRDAAILHISSIGVEKGLFYFDFVSRKLEKLPLELDFFSLSIDALYFDHAKMRLISILPGKIRIFSVPGAELLREVSIAETLKCSYHYKSSQVFCSDGSVIDETGDRSPFYDLVDSSEVISTLLALNDYLITYNSRERRLTAFSLNGGERIQPISQINFSRICGGHGNRIYFLSTSKLGEYYFDNATYRQTFIYGYDLMTGNYELLGADGFYAPGVSYECNLYPNGEVIVSQNSTGRYAYDQDSLYRINYSDSVLKFDLNK